MILDRTIKSHCAILEKIAAKFPPRAKEREVLKTAAFAYIFTMLHHKQSFEAYLASLKKPLTQQEKRLLSKVGA